MRYFSEAESYQISFDFSQNFIRSLIKQMNGFTISPYLTT